MDFRRGRRGGERTRARIHTDTAENVARDTVERERAKMGGSAYTYTRGGTHES